MTLGELKLETLKKMFLNSKPISIEDLEQYKNDKKYNTYLNMFNQALNEGLIICMKRGREILKTYEIISDGKTTLYNLKELVPDYYKLYKFIISGQENTLYKIITDEIIEIPQLSENTKITIVYEAYPEFIKSTDTDDTEIKNHIENLMILPLYIASQLYKDDDIAQATMYRNEFESQVDNKYPKDNNSQFVSVNGWF